MSGARIKEGGFTIVEVLLTLFLVTIIVIVSFDITKVSDQTNSRSRQYAEANALAFGKLQDYETRSFDDIPVGDIADDFVVEDWTAEVIAESGGLVRQPDAKVHVQYEPGSASLIKVRSVLDFQYGNETRKIEYAVYIQRGGVGR